MRILVTGAEGYIGRHLMPKLQDAHHYAIPLCNWPNEPHVRRYAGGPEKRWFCDLSKGFGKLTEEQPPDAVIHLAGRVEISLLPNPKGAHRPPVPGPCDIGALYRDNVVATANVLDYCLKAGVKHLIFASTQAVYGMPESEGSIFTEGSQLRPLEHYAMSKVAAEGLLQVGAGQGLNIMVLRLPGLYGGDRQSGTVWRMCKQAFQDYEIEQTINFPLPFDCLHIEDAVDAFVKAAVWGGSGHQIINIATGVPNDLTQLAVDIAELVEADPVAGTYRALLAMHAEKAALFLGWRAKPRKERLAQVLEEMRRGS